MMWFRYAPTILDIHILVRIVMFCSFKLENILKIKHIVIKFKKEKCQKYYLNRVQVI